MSNIKLHSLLFALPFLFTLLIPQNNQAQSLTEIEYFFDYNDPGLGNATSIVLDPVPEIDMMVSFDASTLPVGIHTLCVRIKDSDNIWSHLNTSPFFKLDGSDQANITELSYWFEGVNNNAASSIPITATAALDATFEIDVSDMEPGIYTLYVSAKNGFGQASILHRKAVQIFSGENDALSIRSLEYFWNDDPGVGNGTNISLNDEVIDTTLGLSLAQSTEPQIDYLSLRVQDQAGKWSIQSTCPVINCPGPIPVADFETVCTGSVVSFINLDPSISEHLWDFGDGNSSTLSNPLHQFAPGAYTVLHYASNECATLKDSVELEFFGIESYTPEQAGKGDVYMNFFGWGFDASTTVKLYKDGQVYTSLNDVVTNIGNAYRGVFDLHEADLGFYDVELTTATESYYFENGMELQEPEFDLRVDIIGRDRTRPGIDELYSIRVHNEGNTRAGSVAVYLFVPNGATVTPLDSIVWADTSVLFGYDTISNIIDVYEADGFPADGQVHAYMIYDIPSTYYKDFRFNLNFEVMSSNDIQVWVQGPYSGSPWFDWTDPCFRAKLYLGYQLTTSIVSLIPVADCSISALKLLAEPIAGAVGVALSGGSIDAWAASSAYKSISNNVAGVLRNCAGEAAAVGTGGVSLVAELALDVAVESVNVQNAYIALQEACSDETEAEKSANIRAATSRDPNAKVGPYGYATANYIKGDDLWMDYTIFYENVDTADLPAQVVTIIDTLDSEVFDFSSFRLNSYGVANNIINIPTSRKEFVNTVDLGNGYLLRASLKLDTLTGIFRADFFTIDPATNDLISDPLAGYLPPNVNKPEGEGNISFSIKLKEGLPNDTPISNKAAIVFDTNEAIETDSWLNTLDFVAPTSTVDFILQTGDSTVIINLEGIDTQSGVYGYEVFVKEDVNDWVYVGDFAEPFTFSGENNLLYEFYFQAIDSVGNIESKAEAAEVSIVFGDFNTIQVIEEPQLWNVYPVPTSDYLFVDFKNQREAINQLSIFDVNGKLMYQENGERLLINNFNIDVQDLINGFYHLELELKDGKALRKYFMKQ